MFVLRGHPGDREGTRRDVAQLGSALDWGSRGRRFKSCRPDWRQSLIEGRFRSNPKPALDQFWGPAGNPAVESARGIQRKAAVDRRTQSAGWRFGWIPCAPEEVSLLGWTDSHGCSGRTVDNIHLRIRRFGQPAMGGSTPSLTVGRVSGSSRVIWPILPRRSPLVRIISGFSPGKADATSTDETKALPATGAPSDRRGAVAGHRRLRPMRRVVNSWVWSVVPSTLCASGPSAAMRTCTPLCSCPSSPACVA